MSGTTLNLKRPNTNNVNPNPFKLMKQNQNQFKIPRNMKNPAANIDDEITKDSIEIKLGEMKNNLIKIKEEKNQGVNKQINKEKNLSKDIINIDNDMEIDKIKEISKSNQEFEKLLKTIKDNINSEDVETSKDETSKDETSKEETSKEEISKEIKSIEDNDKSKEDDEKSKSIELEDSQSNQPEEEEKIQSKKNKRNNDKIIHKRTNQKKLAKKLKNDLKKLRHSNPKLLEALLNKEKTIKTKKQLQNKLKENKFINNKTRVISEEQALQNLELIYNKKVIELQKYYKCFKKNDHNKSEKCGKLLIFLMIDLFINFDGLRSENLDMIFRIQRISKIFNNYIPNQIQLFKMIKGINNHNEKIMKLKKISHTSSKLREIFDNKQSNKLINQLNKITIQNNNLTEKERSILLKSIKVYYFFREHWPTFKIQNLYPEDNKYNHVVILKNYDENKKTNIVKPLIEKIKIIQPITDEIKNQLQKKSKKHKIKSLINYELKINEFNPLTDKLQHIVWNESHLHDVSFCPLKIENTMDVFHYKRNFMNRTMKLFYIDQLNEIRSNDLFKQIVSTEI